MKLSADPNNPDGFLQVAAEDDFETLCQVYETTGIADHHGGAWLIDQTLKANNFWKEEGKANGTLAFIAGIEPQNPLEGLLATQMVTCHNMAMEFSRRAMADNQNVDAVDRNVNRVSKMMRAFNGHVEALQKLRNKGQQKITVQHVQVNQGGQAVIGDISQGGG